MMKPLSTLADGAEGAVRFIGGIMAFAGLGLVLLVSFNVLARYAFGFSSVALQEAEWHLMAIGALFGMAYGINQGGEVRVDVAYEHFPAPLQSLIDLISAALMCACAGIIAYLSIGFVEQSFGISEGSPDPGGLPLRWILKAGIPAGFALLALQAFAMTLRALEALVGGMK